LEKSARDDESFIVAFWSLCLQLAAPSTLAGVGVPTWRVLTLTPLSILLATAVNGVYENAKTLTTKEALALTLAVLTLSYPAYVGTIHAKVRGRKGG